MLKRTLALSLALILGLSCALADTLTLPQGVARIEAEAFAMDPAIREAVLPDGLVSIGDEAFAGCENLGWLTVPGSVTELGADFISGCAEDLLLRTEAGSAACAYAQSNSVDYQAGTVYRALLICQTYPDDESLTLPGPANDALGMEGCLSLFDATDYAVTVRANLTAEGMLDAIAEVFGAATAQDVSLVYYSGHGISSADTSQQGALLGSDGVNAVTAGQLRAALDRIPGRKIVIIDACYSGNLLTARSAAKRGADNAARLDAFNASFISAFSTRTRRGLAADSYFVLTAAAANEQSYEDEVNGHIMGLFTASLLEGCGYSFSPSLAASLPADSNGNRVLTLAELYRYTARLLLSDGQHVQVYPEDCRWFGLLRD